MIGSSLIFQPLSIDLNTVIYQLIKRDIEYSAILPSIVTLGIFRLAPFSQCSFVGRQIDSSIRFGVTLCFAAESVVSRQSKVTPCNLSVSGVYYCYGFYRNAIVYEIGARKFERL